uniref:hypothetical protein n=1 Tax=Prevotella sp. TaxID=59823 RepID=UPI003FEDF0F2
MEKKKNEELQSRRDFFKKAAKGALPILGMVVVGPSFMSCSKDDDEYDGDDDYDHDGSGSGGSSSGGSSGGGSGSNSCTG